MFVAGTALEMLKGLLGKVIALAFIVQAYRSPSVTAALQAKHQRQICEAEDLAPASRRCRALARAVHRAWPAGLTGCS